MHARVEHPVTWPSDAGWQTWWRLQTLELDRTTVGKDGVLDFPDEPDGPDPDTEQIRLTRGEHLRGGARYQLGSSSLPTVRLAAAIAGPPGGRVLAVHGKRTTRRGSVEVDVDGLDVLRRVSSTSGMPTLRWTASFEPDRRGLLDLDVRLRWLRARAEARVVPARDGVGERLVVVVRVRGRGRWRPVVGAFLGLVPSSRVRTELAAAVAAAAERLSLMDTDPTFATLQSRDEEYLARGSALVQERALAVFEPLEHRSLARASERAWKRGYAALPPPEWPPLPDGVYETWEWRESAAMQRVLRARARDRRDVVLGLARWVQEDYRALMAAGPADLPASEDPASGAPSEEDIDLDWLASPWTVYRYGRRQYAREKAAAAPGASAVPAGRGGRLP